MQKSRDRRRSDTGKGEPAVQRKNGRFGPESEKAEEKDDSHESIGKHIAEVSPIDKLSSAVERRHDHSKKAHGCAADAVGGVTSCGEHALMVLVKADKRDRDQSQHLKEHIHRDQIVSAGHSEGDAVCHHVKSEEYILAGGMLHIIECIEDNERPHDRNHARKEHRRSVNFERHRKSFNKAVDNDRFPRAAGKSDPHRDAGQDRDGLRVDISYAVASETDRDN